MMTLQKTQELAVLSSECAPVTLLSVGRGWGKTTAGLVACRRRALEQKIAVIVTRYPDEIAHSYPHSFEGDGIYRCQQNYRLIVEDGDGLSPYVLNIPGATETIRQIHPDLVVLENVDLWDAGDAEQIILASSGTHFLITGTPPSTSDDRNKSGSGWFRWALETAFKHGWVVISTSASTGR